jgi:uncharacterized membrane protein YkvA (DUF1232 family)
MVIRLAALLKEKAKKLKYNLSALYLVYKRKDVPMYAKVIPLIAIGYALSPIDLIRICHETEKLF